MNTNCAIGTIVFRDGFAPATRRVGRLFADDHGSFYSHEWICTGTRPNDGAMRYQRCDGLRRNPKQQPIADEAA